MFFSLVQIKGKGVYRLQNPLTLPPLKMVQQNSWNIFKYISAVQSEALIRTLNHSFHEGRWCGISLDELYFYLSRDIVLKDNAETIKQSKAVGRLFGNRVPLPIHPPVFIENESCFEDALSNLILYGFLAILYNTDEEGGECRIIVPCPAITRLLF
jgi:hypothetical protein